MIRITDNTVNRIVFEKETRDESWFNNDCSNETIMKHAGEAHAGQTITRLQFEDGDFIGSILKVYFNDKPTLEVLSAVEFPEQNFVLAKDQDQYNTLPCHVTDDRDRIVTTCFDVTPEQERELMKTGKLWVEVWTFGHPFQPIRISVVKPNGLKQ